MTTPDSEPSPVERRLAAWRPAGVAGSRDRMLFEAGRASARPGRLWRASALILAVASLGLGGQLVRERSRRSAVEAELAAFLSAQPTPQLAVQPTPPPLDLEPLQLAPSSYLMLTARLRSGNLDEPTPDVAEPARPEPAAPNRPTLRPWSFDRVLEL